MDIYKDLYELCACLLKTDELTEATLLTKNIRNQEKIQNVIFLLQRRVGYSPKRPLYYAHNALRFLPHETRDSVRYLGDFIDQLIKHIAADLLKSEKYKKRSLGSNITSLKGKLSIELFNALDSFNKLIYTPAKHEFNVPSTRKHLFTPEEVIFICFIVSKLKAGLLPISKEGKEYCNNHIYEYYYDDDIDDRNLIVKRLFSFIKSIKHYLHLINRQPKV